MAKNSILNQDGVKIETYNTKTQKFTKIPKKEFELINDKNLNIEDLIFALIFINTGKK
jgi:hypothetical protein